MPTENTYSLQDLADLAGVSPRTIRYYVAQGLLPSPGQVGPGPHYTDGHLARLRLIRRLQREHLPLAEIRTRLASLDDDAIASLLETEAPRTPPEDSALEYVRTILGGEAGHPQWRANQASLIAPASKAAFALGVPGLRRPADAFDSTPLRPAEGEPARRSEPAQRSQWDRVTLTPDIELNIRRPLSRQQNKQVERLIAIARELLEEDPS